jgi:hypothetical protein
VALRVFTPRLFRRFARAESISDHALCEAIRRAERGIVDANLGGGVIKQRVARPGQGRSGGFRTLIAYRAEARAVFVHGFAKSDQDNIGDDELAELRASAREMLSWNEAKVRAMLESRAWTEIDCDG